MPYEPMRLESKSSPAGAAIAVWLAVVVFVLLCRIIYLTWFHPLAKYPGPLLARYTNLYGAYRAWKGDVHHDLHRYHGIYGDYVRYAPNRVSMNTAAALYDIYGHGARVQKFKGYQALSSMAANTLTMSDKAQHAARRRFISQAFSQSSLRMLEPAIRSRIERFCRQISITDLAFDLMTAVTFGKDYNTTEDPRFRYVVQCIETSNVRLGVLFQASELAFGKLDRIFLKQSVIASARFVNFLSKLLQYRLQTETTEIKDIFSYLQRCKDPDTGQGLSPKEISTETATFIVAGSDTTSTAMASLAHYLASSSRHYRLATHEIRTTFSSVDEISFGPQLNACVFLRACLDEALRITPPGGGPLWREVEPPTGAVIDGEYIPAGCIVGSSIYAMHHSPRNWEDPNKFVPERWMHEHGHDKEKEGARRPTAYFPFGFGPRSCVGKPLAIAEVMLTFALLLWQFDFRRADSDRDSVGEWWEGDDTEAEEYVLKDHVTGQKQGPVLCFRSRFRTH
ncbi:putative cytochrome P450 [Nemania sp. FL0916]|nr:putative cytochrome P450 [Nemania sp. FL0916]